MAFILNLLWSNWPRRVLTLFFIQFVSYRPSLVKSSWRRAVLHHKILPAVRAVFLSGRGSIRFQIILRWPVRVNSGWWFGVLVDFNFSTNLNSDAALGYGDAKRNPAWFSSNICSNTKSNSVRPAKLASASLFAGQFRGDSTLIQTQFGFLISLPYSQSNLQSD